LIDQLVLLVGGHDQNTAKAFISGSGFDARAAVDLLPGE